jgi:hypothetical protein
MAAYPDRYHLTKDQNRRFARQNFVNLVHTNSRFEDITTTLPQTQTIMDGLGVDGIPIDDINIMVRLKRGWQFITASDEPLTLDFERQINAIVTGRNSTELAEKESNFLTALMQDTHRSATDKALTLLYHNMRQQLFWDGNKRTATLAANKIMIDHGVGLINVPLNLWPHWNELISAYYHSGAMTEIKQWTYDHAIQGVVLK